MYFIAQFCNFASYNLVPSFFRTETKLLTSHQVKARDYKRDRKGLEKKLEGLKPVSCQVCKNIEQYYMDGIIMVKTFKLSLIYKARCLLIYNDQNLFL